MYEIKFFIVLDKNVVGYSFYASATCTFIHITHMYGKCQVLNGIKIVKGTMPPMISNQFFMFFFLKQYIIKTET